MSADLGIGGCDFETVARQGLGPDAAVLRLSAEELSIRYLVAARYLRAIITQYGLDQLDPNVRTTSAMSALIQGASLEVK